MKEVDLAYIAGLFDGEGSAMLITMQPKKNRPNHCTYMPSISIANSHLPTLQFILKVLGVGAISTKGQHVNYEVYQWYCTGINNVNTVARMLYKFSRIKQKELLSLMHYCASQPRNSNKARAYSRHNKRKYMYYMSRYEKLAQDTLADIHRIRESSRKNLCP